MPDTFDMVENTGLESPTTYMRSKKNTGKRIFIRLYKRFISY